MRALQRAVPGDRERIEGFQRAAYARTEVAIGARAIPLTWDYGTIMRECEVWLDERDGVLAGVLILRARERELFLVSIATSPEMSGSGIGSGLMASVFQRARALGSKRIALITNGRNPALGWYRKLGFAVDHEEVEDGRTVLHMSLKTDGTSGDTKGENDDGTA